MIYSPWYQQVLALRMVHNSCSLKCWLNKEETELSEPITLTSLVVTSNQLHTLPWLRRPILHWLWAAIGWFILLALNTWWETWKMILLLSLTPYPITHPSSHMFRNLYLINTAADLIRVSPVIVKLDCQGNRVRILNCFHVLQWAIGMPVPYGAGSVCGLHSSFPVRWSHLGSVMMAGNNV